MLNGAAFSFGVLTSVGRWEGGGWSFLLEWRQTFMEDRLELQRQLEVRVLCPWGFPPPSSCLLSPPLLLSSASSLHPPSPSLLSLFFPLPFPIPLPAFFFKLRGQFLVKKKSCSILVPFSEETLSLEIFNYESLSGSVSLSLGVFGNSAWKSLQSHFLLWSWYVPLGGQSGLRCWV